MWSIIFYLGRGQASLSSSLSFSCPAIDILEFLSTGNDPQLLTQQGLIFLLPQSQSKYVLFLATGQKELVQSMGGCYILCYPKRHADQVQN